MASTPRSHFRAIEKSLLAASNPPCHFERSREISHRFIVLTGNATHGIIHIVLGFIGVWTGWQNRARGFCIFLGILLIAVGILWFIPSGNELVVRLLNVNKAVACVNLVVGAISLIAGLSSSAPQPSLKLEQSPPASHTHSALS